MKPIFWKPVIIVPLLLLGACTTPQGGTTTDPIQGIAEFAKADLEAAKVSAVAHEDYSADCWQALLDMLGEDRPAPTDIKGVFSGVQAARNVRRAVQGGVPEAVHKACAVVVLDAQQTFNRLLLMAGGSVIPLPKLP